MHLSTGLRRRARPGRYGAAARRVAIALALCLSLPLSAIPVMADGGAATATQAVPPSAPSSSPATASPAPVSKASPPSAVHATAPAASSSSAQPETAQPGQWAAFAAGERLTYELAWSRLKAGTAVMAVEAAEPQNGHAQMKLSTVAQSSSLISKFYPIDNRVESWIDAGSLLPQRMVFNRREGKRRNAFDFTFRQAEGKVTAVKDGQSSELEIAPNTHDAISCLYYVRTTLPLIPGTSSILNVHHDKKNYKLEVRVEGFERIEGAWGASEAVRVLVIMPFQGIFLNEGNVRVWLSNDERRIPLLMKAKVVVGAVTATLVDGFR